MRTNVGADFWDSQLFAAVVAGTQANYIGITTNTTPPVATDIVLAGEETLNGLARTQASVFHTLGTNTAVLSATYTYTGGVSKTLAKAGLFTAVSGGTLILETLLVPTTTVQINGDQIVVQWNITY
jgi:hypothetical protein